MLQLSLLSDVDAVDLESRLRSLAGRARARGIAPHIVERAVRASRARFAAGRAVALTDAEDRRVRAYFDAIVRRSIMSATDEGSRVLYRRLVAASIEADLRAAGWDRARAAEEARRTLGVAEDAVAVA